MDFASLSHVFYKLRAIVGGKWLMGSSLIAEGFKLHAFISAPKQKGIAVSDPFLCPYFYCSGHGEIVRQQFGESRLAFGITPQLWSNRMGDCFGCAGAPACGSEVRFFGPDLYSRLKITPATRTCRRGPRLPARAARPEVFQSKVRASHPSLREGWGTPAQTSVLPTTQSKRETIQHCEMTKLDIHGATTEELVRLYERAATEHGVGFWKARREKRTEQRIPLQPFIGNFELEAINHAKRSCRFSCPTTPACAVGQVHTLWSSLLIKDMPSLRIWPRGET